ncbi:hypothetical protein [Streptomyces sp. NPDC051310]|uniref:hypothetical protein n=1 Tax=Streptomyces sp. NPDC051310 TaxID=3365649 RepID=UPI0037AA4234
MATSAVPAAIDALLALLQAAPELAGVQVLDGPPAVDMAAADFISVGWQPESDDAAQLQQRFAYAGARRRDEEFVILGWLESWTGDADIRPRRLRAFELLATLETILRATDAAPTAPTLEGTVLWSEFTAGALRQQFTNEGTRAGIAWAVAGRARI